MVSQYLGEYLTREEIIEEGMEELVYIRKEKQKRKASKRRKVAKNVNKKHKPKAKRKNTKVKASLDQSMVKNLDNTTKDGSRETLKMWLTTRTTLQ